MEGELRGQKAGQAEGVRKPRAGRGHTALVCWLMHKREVGPGLERREEVVRAYHTEPPCSSPR